jgi:hypothetical protein
VNIATGVADRYGCQSHHSLSPLPSVPSKYQTLQGRGRGSLCLALCSQQMIHMQISMNAKRTWSASAGIVRARIHGGTKLRMQLRWQQRHVILYMREHGTCISEQGRWGGVIGRNTVEWWIIRVLFLAARERAELGECMSDGFALMLVRLTGAAYSAGAVGSRGASSQANCSGPFFAAIGRCPVSSVMLWILTGGRRNTFIFRPIRPTGRRREAPVLGQTGGHDPHTNCSIPSSSYTGLLDRRLDRNLLQKFLFFFNE